MGKIMANLKWGGKSNDPKAVEALQQKLNKAGAKPKLKVDGQFGKKTYEAVKAFQKATGSLKVDGVVGSKTMTELDKGKPAKDDKSKDTKGKDAKGGDGKKAKTVPKWPYVDPLKTLFEIKKLRKDNKAATLDRMKDLAQHKGGQYDVLRRQLLEADQRANEVFSKMWNENNGLGDAFTEYEQAAKKKDGTKATEIVTKAKPLAKKFQGMIDEFDLAQAYADKIDKQALALLEGKKVEKPEWPYDVETTHHRRVKSRYKRFWDANDKKYKKARGAISDKKTGDDFDAKRKAIFDKFMKEVEEMTGISKRIGKICADFEKLPKGASKQAWDMIGKAKPMVGEIEDANEDAKKIVTEFKELIAQVEKAAAKPTTAAAGT